MIFAQCIVPDFLHCNWSAVLTPQLNAFLSEPSSSWIAPCNLVQIRCEGSYIKLVSPSLPLSSCANSVWRVHQICISLCLYLVPDLIMFSCSFWHSSLCFLFSTLPNLVTYFSSVTLSIRPLYLLLPPSLLQACVVSTHLCCRCPLLPLPPKDLPGYHLVVAWVVQVLPLLNGPRAP